MTQIGYIQFIGYTLVSVIGTLLHFLYDWTDKSFIVSLFSGVNESTWEHMKLLFFAMLLSSVIESLIIKDTRNFWCVKLRGILLGLAMIPLLFYMYNGIIGKSPDYINIAIFFISGAVAFLYETRLLKKDKECKLSQKTSIIILTLLALLFFVFTYKTPHLNIFKDPLSGEYGI